MSIRVGDRQSTLQRRTRFVNLVQRQYSRLIGLNLVIFSILNRHTSVLLSFYHLGQILRRLNTRCRHTRRHNRRRRSNGRRVRRQNTTYANPFGGPFGRISFYLGPLAKGRLRFETQEDLEPKLQPKLH